MRSLVFLLVLGSSLGMGAHAADEGKATLASAGPARIWTPPDVAELPSDEHGALVRLGRDVFAATFRYVGPDVDDREKRFAGNNLACRNCHLHAGTERFALPVYGLKPDYPRYSARSGQEATLTDRLNSCMRRSMNGRAMPPDARELQALLAYVTFLSSGMPAGVTLSGGAGAMPELDRAASPQRGAPLYADRCAYCHGANGEGVRRSAPWVDLGYMIPPLWGPDSFNDGAGMNRLITAANFIHSNMPHGVDYLNPQLTPEDAWDVAAYVLSRPRPRMQGLDQDFPDLRLKPVDTAYGPYADDFSEEQHKYGPFGPIRAALDRLK